MIAYPSSDQLDDRISYFYHLYDYSPENSHGSCGYVSFIQYLSYYDCFYNDNIIPEQFERNQGSVSSMDLARLNSPGVLRQSYPEEPLELYQFIDYNKNFDYQMYLMSIVNINSSNAPSNYSYTVGMWKYHYILDTISVFDDTSFYYRDYRYYGINAIPTDQYVISAFDIYVKTLLDQGRPVMLHIGEYDPISGDIDGYHSVVAYYYDDLGIHANFGWGPNSTDTVISSSYQIIYAGYINFDNVDIFHSDNFIVNNHGYCGCHNFHTYNDSYSNYSTTMHKAFCHCGSYLLKPHAVSNSSIYIRHGHRYGICIDCGATVDLGTDFGEISFDSILINLITDNGSYIMPNGVYIITDEDLFAYLSDSLVFHSRADVRY